MTLQTASSCACELFRELVGGGRPEYFYTPQKAAQRFLEHQREFEVSQHLPAHQQPRYWAVHLNGAHVISVDP